MNEAQWLTSTDPAAMFHHLRYAPVGVGGRLRRTEEGGPLLASDRKLRLFAAAMAIQAWGLKYALSAKGGYEHWANGEADPSDHEDDEASPLRVVRSWLSDPEGAIGPTTQAAILRDIIGNPFADCTWLIHRCPHCGQEGRWHFRGSDDALGEWLWCPDCNVEMRHRRDIWCDWREGTVPRLAAKIYDERAFDRMPILADALEEAGCSAEEKCPSCQGEKGHVVGVGVWQTCGPCRATGHVPNPLLQHLRGPGPHVRGCHVVDALLDKS